MNTLAWIEIAGVSALGIGLLWLIFRLSRPDWRKYGWYGAAAGVGVAAVVVSVNEGWMTFDTLASIVGSASAAFGGAWFAFRLQRDEARDAQIREFKKSELEKLQTILNKLQAAETRNQALAISIYPLQVHAFALQDPDLLRGCSELYFAWMMLNPLNTDEPNQAQGEEWFEFRGTLALVSTLASGQFWALHQFKRVEPFDWEKWEAGKIDSVTPEPAG